MTQASRERYVGFNTTFKIEMIDVYVLLLALVDPTHKAKSGLKYCVCACSDWLEKLVCPHPILFFGQFSWPKQISVFRFHSFEPHHLYMCLSRAFLKEYRRSFLISLEILYELRSQTLKHQEGLSKSHCVLCLLN